MWGISELVAREKSQYVVYLGIALAVLALTVAGFLYDRTLFQRFLGPMNPIAAIIIVSLAGIVLLTVLLSRGWFAISAATDRSGLGRYFLLVPVFALVAILVDLTYVFPADQNILFPGSLAFYPSIGFAVEVIFHLLPLTILLVILAPAFKGAGQERVMWVCIFAAALLEPILQVILGGNAKPYPLWAAVAVGLNVFLINLTQLTLFKRYDFVATYSFRLAYYLIWHILWGYFRLQILF